VWLNLATAACVYISAKFNFIVYTLQFRKETISTDINVVELETLKIISLDLRHETYRTLYG